MSLLSTLLGIFILEFKISKSSIPSKNKKKYFWLPKAPRSYTIYIITIIFLLPGISMIVVDILLMMASSYLHAAFIDSKPAGRKTILGKARLTIDFDNHFFFSKN